jgi:hypothetical protein
LHLLLIFAFKQRSVQSWTLPITHERTVPRSRVFSFCEKDERREEERRGEKRREEERRDKGEREREETRGRECA